MLIAFLGVMVLVAVVDVRSRRIPHILLLVGVIASAFSHLSTAAYFLTELHWWDVVEYGVLLLPVIFGAVWITFRGEEVFGMGDFKLLALLWIWCFPATEYFFGIVFSGAIGILVWHLVFRLDSYPFAPFLTVGWIIMTAITV